MDENGYSDHERRIRNLERTLKTDSGVVRAFGIAVGASAGYEFLGPYARHLGEFIGESWHGVDLAVKLGKNYFRNKDSVDKYLDRIDGQVGESYVKNTREENILKDISVEGMEGMQRGALKVPSVESKPVRGLRDIKGWIIDKTKGVITGEKEEAEIQNSEGYRDNYNALARLRVSAVEKRELLKAEIVGQSKKLEENEYNTGSIDEEGLKIFEDLIKEYNNTSDVLRNIFDLDIREINSGTLDARYQKAVSDANAYRIIPYSAENLGDVGVLGATILGGYLGYKISKPIIKISNMAYNTGKVVAKGVYKTGKKVLNKMRKKKLNTLGDNK